MAEQTTVARPYAKAAFQYAMEQQALADWSAMLNFAANVVADETVSQVLSDPRITSEQRAEVMQKVCGEEINEAGKNYIALLARNDRLAALPEIAELFEELKAEQEKTVDVEITSAFPLSDGESTKLAGALKNKLSREVNITTNVDESLIGGVIIRAGDMVINSSVKGKLAKLAETVI